MTRTFHAWTLDGDLVFGRNDIYKIEFRGSRAPVVLTRDVDPAPLESGERAEWEVWNQRAEDSVPAGAEPVPHPPIPAIKPYFRGILVGDSGRIWVHRYVRAEERGPLSRSPTDRLHRLTWTEPPTFDVFDPDATFLATVVLPRDTQVFAIRDRRVWVVHTDEASVARIVRLHVESVGR